MNFSPVNNFFDHVFVINLSSRLDRKLKMRERLSLLHIKAEFVEATDGNSAINRLEFENYLKKPIEKKTSHELELSYNRKAIKSNGAWGYLKTYKRVLELAKRRGYDNVLCLDDDVIFHKNFNSEFLNFSCLVSGEWRLIYLGATQHIWNAPFSHRYSNSQATNYDPNELFYHPLVTDGSFAIGIHSSIYNELISQIKLFNCPFDSGPLRYISKRFNEQCYVAQPNLIIADVTDSDIGKKRNQFELAEKVKWDMELYDYYINVDLVSVIIPVYNAEKTIEKSVKSILNQSYQNIEVIVADDASTDSTVEIVKRLKKKDDRIILLENPENRGCYFVRNDAIRVSKGEFIAIQDADDISISNRIEKQIIALISEEAQFTISRIYRSRCEMGELDIENEVEMMRLVESRRVPSNGGDFDYQDRPILGFNSSMFKRSLFEKLGLFWESRFAADAEFCERILYTLADIRLGVGENIHSFLMDCEPIEGLYIRVDEVLLISAQMGDDNITNKYSSEEKKEFELLWRNKFEGNNYYEYPVLSSDQVLDHSADSSEIRMLKNKCHILEQKLRVKDGVKEQVLEATRKRNLELENSLAWYDRTYGHLPKWFLKIGGIFRRWPFK